MEKQDFNKKVLSMLSSLNVDNQRRQVIYEIVKETINKIADVTNNQVGQKTANGGEVFNDYENNTATAQYSHAERFSTTASGDSSHAEGNFTKATGYASHAEGFDCIAKGDKSHAEGDTSEAIGEASHAEGSGSIAKGDYSHAEGYTYANGKASHSEGYFTTANNYVEHASGSYNKSTTSETDSATKWKGDNVATLFSIGNSTSDSNRKNAFEVKQDGTIIIQKPGTDEYLTNLYNYLIDLNDRIAKLENPTP